MRAKLFALSAIMAAASPLAAAPPQPATLIITDPVIRVAWSGAKTGAGYMVIRNRGARPDRLLRVETAASTRADLHATVAQGNIQQMRVSTGGVPIPAGGTIYFAPGGQHVMFIGLKHAMPEESVMKARLIFERAGAMDVSFKAKFAATAQ